MYKPMTVKDLKHLLATHNVPDDAIVCCQSDSEGNETSTCLNMFIDTVGRDVVMNYCGQEYHYIAGDDVQGIDLDKDKGKIIITFQPSL